MLNNKQLQHCIELATEIADMYAENYPRMNAEEPARDVESTLWLCSVRVAKAGKWIRTRVTTDAEIPAVAEMGVWGMLVVLDDGYEIVTLPDLDEKLRRLVAIKEGFQLLMDEIGVRDLDLMKHVAEMTEIASVTAMPAGSITLTASSALELMAVVAAMEFVLPYKKRVEELANGKDGSAVAEKYGVPKDYVELYLSQQSIDSFRQFSRQD